MNRHQLRRQRDNDSLRQLVELYLECTNVGDLERSLTDLRSQISLAREMYRSGGTYTKLGVAIFGNFVSMGADEPDPRTEYARRLCEGVLRFGLED